MHCVGIDIIEIERIDEALQRFGQRFLHRIYTEPELMICQEKPHSLATRFAAKEAVMKALGTGIKGVSWKEIEIQTAPTGKPLVYLYGKAKDKAVSLGLDNLAISLSDSKEYAVALVVGEAK